MWLSQFRNIWALGWEYDIYKYYIYIYKWMLLYIYWYIFLHIFIHVYTYSYIFKHIYTWICIESSRIMSSQDTYYNYTLTSIHHRPGRDLGRRWRRRGPGSEDRQQICHPKGHFKRTEIPLEIHWNYLSISSILGAIHPNYPPWSLRNSMPLTFGW